jgi:hypothetical protein
LSNVQQLDGNLARLRDGTIEQFDRGGAQPIAQVAGAVAVSGGIASEVYVPTSAGTGYTVFRAVSSASC